MICIQHKVSISLLNSYKHINKNKTDFLTKSPFQLHMLCLHDSEFGELLDVHRVSVAYPEYTWTHGDCHLLVGDTSHQPGSTVMEQCLNISSSHTTCWYLHWTEPLPLRLRIPHIDAQQIPAWDTLSIYTIL
jgi:hypothetical protein